MLYVPARWKHTGRRKAIRLIVVHETISPEQGSGAEDVARYFQTVARPASTQRVADSNSTVMCVRDEDTCAGAAGANADGLHMELVGPGNQSEAAWHDPFSWATVVEAGKSMREWAREYDVPRRWLSVSQVRDEVSKGFCTHDDVSHAFPEVSTGHSDPQNFPKAWAMGLWFPTQEQEAPTDMSVLIKEPVTGRWMSVGAETKKHETDRSVVRKKVFTGLLRWAGYDTPFDGSLDPYDDLLASAVEVK